MRVRHADGREEVDAELHNLRQEELGQFDEDWTIRSRGLPNVRWACTFLNDEGMCKAGRSVRVVFMYFVVMHTDQVQRLNRLCSAAPGQHLRRQNTGARWGTSAAAAATLFMLLQFFMNHPGALLPKLFQTGCQWLWLIFQRPQNPPMHVTQA